MTIIENNRPKINIVQHSCESPDAGDASIASACQTERESKDELLFLMPKMIQDIFCSSGEMQPG